MYITESINKYISDLAARRPTPGGGSAAGLCGALGVALLEMVCNFTTGNDKYKNVQEDIQNHLSTLKKAREEFAKWIDEDVKLYSAIRSAFKTKDKKVTDKALKDGYDISFKMCDLSKSSMQIALDLSDKGNPNLITDVGCGTELLNAAFNSGVLNAEINLKGIEDLGFVEKERTILDALKKQLSRMYKDTIDKIHHKM